MSASWKVLPRARASPDERSDIMKTIGVVVGGTFTDIIYCDMHTGEAVIRKVSATPDNPSRAVVASVAELCRENAIRTRDFVFHRATTPTDAVFEYCGARTGRVTNEGFRNRPYRSSPAGQAPFHHAGTPWQAARWSGAALDGRHSQIPQFVIRFGPGNLRRRLARRVSSSEKGNVEIASQISWLLGSQCNRRPRPAAREVGLLPTDRRCGRFALFRLSR